MKEYLKLSWQNILAKKLLLSSAVLVEKLKLEECNYGTISGKLSQKSYLTADDPGNENVSDICHEIAEFIKEEHGKYEIIEDRHEAIQKAILENKGSIILVLGKGSENTQKCNGKSVPYETDGKNVEEALKEYDNNYLRHISNPKN